MSAPDLAEASVRFEAESGRRITDGQRDASAVTRRVPVRTSGSCSRETSHSTSTASAGARWRSPASHRSRSAPSSDTALSNSGLIMRQRSGDSRTSAPPLRRRPTPPHGVRPRPEDRLDRAPRDDPPWPTGLPESHPDAPITRGDVRRAPQTHQGGSTMVANRNGLVRISYDGCRERRCRYFDVRVGELFVSVTPPPYPLST